MTDKRAYERASIARDLLIRHPDGLTWQEALTALGLPVNDKKRRLWKRMCADYRMLPNGNESPALADGMTIVCLKPDYKYRLVSITSDIKEAMLFRIAVVNRLIQRSAYDLKLLINLLPSTIPTAKYIEHDHQSVINDMEKVQLELVKLAA